MARGITLLVVGLAAAAWAAMVIRDFVTTEYRGYEVGFVRGMAIVLVVVSLLAWGAGAISLARSLRKRSGSG